MKIEQTAHFDEKMKQKGLEEYMKNASNFKDGQTNTYKVADGIFLDTHESSAIHGKNTRLQEHTYQMPAKGNKQDQKAQSVEESMDQTKAMSAKARKNQMIVLSNTLSKEDYQKVQENGFSLSETSSEKIVTVSDKIKTVLAKAGVDVSSYGDSLDAKELEKITGSKTVANQIMQKLKEMDLPETNENVQEVSDVFGQMQSMNSVTDEMKDFLIRNEKEPTIENIYKAQYSSALPYSSENNANTIDQLYEELESQITEVIKNAGLEVNESNIANAKWLVERELPVHTANLKYLDQLNQLSEMVLHKEDSDVFLKQIMDGAIEAIAEGKRPAEGYLISGYSNMDRAKEAYEVIQETTELTLSICQQKGMAFYISNFAIANAIMKNESGNQFGIEKQSSSMITAQRQLEEIRLSMTVKANYSLLKKGISIDTQPIEQLVDTLKNEENSYYQDLLAQSGVDVSEETVSVFSETTIMVEQLKMHPAYVLNQVDAGTITLRGIHQAGLSLQNTLKQANESYEALMTSPRKDMGDSIQKAFQNVDDILEDLGKEPSEENRRAVRILAYNQAKISAEQIDTMKAADEKIQRVFKNMTPAVTLEMIRKNQNPLDMELSQLNQLAEDIKTEIGQEDTEHFSKFLWKLDHHKEISQEERESFIGIYRLINQVEKTDGAAVGYLVEQGAKLTMRNLLSAVRSGHKGQMEYKISDEFHGVERVKKGKAIDEQISSAFEYQMNCLKDVKEELTPSFVLHDLPENWEDMTPEQIKQVMNQQEPAQMEAEMQLEEEYQMEQLSEYEEVVQASSEVYEMLEQYDIPNTMTNVIAANRLLQDSNQMFHRLFPKTSGDGQFLTMSETDYIKERLLEMFAEAVKSPKELAEAQEELAKVAENAMKSMITENKTITAADLRELRIMNQEFSICARQAKEETYMIPVQTGDSVTGISLKIVRGTKKKGLVDIVFRDAYMGKVAASFKAKEDGISGMVATDKESTRQLISEHIGLFVSLMQEDAGEDAEAIDLSVAYAKNLDLQEYTKKSVEGYANSNKKEEPATLLNTLTSEDEHIQKVQTKRLYRVAEKFIETMREIMD